MALPRITYRPDGFPELGLAPTTVTFRYRKDANLRALARKLERWEASRGNAVFEARHLHRLPVELAFELVNVYAALRERHPQIRPDFVDFAGTGDDKILATAVSYGDALPTIRQLAETYDFDTLDEDALVEAARAEDSDPGAMRAVRAEAAYMVDERIIDPTASGSIVFGDMFRKKRSYQRLLAFWEARNARAVARGLTPRVVDNAVTAASFTLIHEFGHLVEADLLAKGYRPTERVYRELTRVILGVADPSPRQWAYHLVNYPTYEFTSLKGPQEGGAERRRQVRRIHAATIRERIGAYAGTYRDELFAEAFANAYGGRTRAFRREFAPFLDALAAAGVARRSGRR